MSEYAAEKRKLEEKRKLRGARRSGFMTLSDPHSKREGARRARRTTIQGAHGQSILVSLLMLLQSFFKLSCEKTEKNERRTCADYKLSSKKLNNWLGEHEHMVCGLWLSYSRGGIGHLLLSFQIKMGKTRLWVVLQK